MREFRSPTQVLFSYLPNQTSDIKSRVWKVDGWTNPRNLPVDTEAVRRRLIGAVEPWRVRSTDSNMASQLFQGRTIEVVGVNPEQGVKVSAFPNAWRCRTCRRVGYQRGRCVCGSNSWAQMQFVAFHECGWIGDPLIPSCPAHYQAAVSHSTSTSVRDLKFSCPVCNRDLPGGLGGGRPCPACKQPYVIVNVHRAASVYTAYPITMVNPARPENLAALLADGGPEKSLRWVLGDMATERPEKLALTRQTLLDNLVAQGLEPAVAAAAAAAAAASSGLPDGPTELSIRDSVRESAEGGAVEIALAMYEGRRTASRLPDEPVGEELEAIYRDKYAPAVVAAGLRDVDHLDRFPILRGSFGYTRGGKAPGETRLVPFTGWAQSIRVYADANETEALYLRLDPVRVAAWLHARGLLTEASIDAQEARLTILDAAVIPSRGDDDHAPTAGTAVLTLLHSYSHRFIRQLAVLAGVDRESLAEYLVPEHLGAFIYATPRGDFVLGGLQAVFETELNRVLDLQVEAETRCPLDPGCSRASGACLACLHIGEPSCTHFNRFLDRTTLFGDNGYLRTELA